MESKKIYFDGLGLVDGFFTGIGQYILGILRGLDAIIESEKLAGRPTPQIQVIIPYNSRKRFNSFNFKHIQPKLFPLSFRVMSGLWYRGKLPPIDLYCGKGFYVFTRFVGMPLVFSKSAVIIYDLSYELYKQHADERTARFLSEGTRKTLASTEHVFTISQSAKNDIMQIYKEPKQNITVAYPAADQRYFYHRSAKEITKVTAKYGIKNNYILSLSSLEPRKNLDALVDAYCNLPPSYRKDTSLLLVGVNGWKTDALFKKIITRVKEGYDIIRPSKFVTDKDKPAIISGAKMLVYPSHYEGFGMPPLEGLACGTPVITANNSSLPEAVGNAGTKLDCSDVQALTKAMQTHLDNLQIISEKTRSSGPEQAQKFSWEQSAKLYWDFIKERAA